MGVWDSRRGHRKAIGGILEDSERTWEGLGSGACSVLRLGLIAKDLGNRGIVDWGSWEFRKDWGLPEPGVPRWWVRLGFQDRGWLAT